MEKIEDFLVSNDKKKQQIGSLWNMVNATLSEQNELKNSNSSKAHFIAYISMILSSKSNKELRKDISYLISLIISDIPAEYIFQHFELLFQSFLELVDSITDETAYLLKPIIKALEFIMKVRLNKENSKNCLIFVSSFIRLLQLLSSDKSLIKKNFWKMIKVIADCITSSTRQTFISSKLLFFFENLLSYSNETSQLSQLSFLLSCSKVLSSSSILNEKDASSLCLSLLNTMNNQVPMKKDIANLYFSILNNFIMGHYLNAECRHQLFYSLLDKSISFDCISMQPSLTSKWTKVLLNLLRNEKNAEIKSTITQNLKRIMEHHLCIENDKHVKVTLCIVRSCIDELNDFKEDNGGDSSSNNISNSNQSNLSSMLCDFINGFFHWKYHHALYQCIPAISDLVKTLRSEALPILNPCVIGLDKIIKEHQQILRGQESHSLDEAADQLYRSSLSVIADFIRYTGPERILMIIPLDFDSDECRDWLLPLLKKNLESPSLSFYLNNLLNLGNELKLRSASIKMGSSGDNVSQGDEKKAALSLTRYYQIWSLLPAFTKKAKDFEESFSSMKDLLIDALKDSEVVPFVAHALASSLEDFGSSSESLKSSSVLFLEQFYSLYIHSVKEKRNFILDTMKALYRVTNPSLIEGYFVNILKQLLMLSKNISNNDSLTPGSMDTDKTLIIESVVSMMDVLISLIPFLSESPLKSTLKAFLHFLNNMDELAIQKKVFAGFAVLFCQPHWHWRALNQEEIARILSALRRPNHHKSHYKAINVVIATLPSSFQNEFLKSLLPQIILGLKESNETVREISFNTVEIIGKKLLEGTILLNGLVKYESPIDEFFVMVGAGLAGQSTRMMSATMTCLGYLVAKFSDSISPTVFEQLIEITVSLRSLTLDSQEWNKSYIELIKSLLFSGSSDDIRKHLLEKNLSSLLSCLFFNPSASSTFKLKLRHIVEKCSTIYGMGTIETSFPEEHRNLLAHIKKTYRSILKKSLKNSASMDSVGDESSSVTHELSNSSISTPSEKQLIRKQRRLVDLEESVNLLDPSVKNLLDRSFDIMDKGSNDSDSNEADVIFENGKLICKEITQDEDGGATEDGLNGYFDLSKIEEEYMSQSEDDDELIHKDVGFSDNKRNVNNCRKISGKIKSAVVSSRQRGIQKAGASSTLVMNNRKGILKTKQKIGLPKKVSGLEDYAYVPLNRKLLMTNRGKSNRKQLYHKNR